MSEDVLASAEPWCCPQCDYESETERSVQSHIGAKHVRRLKPVKHGTWQGYKMERRRKMTTCPACKIAWRRYCAEIRARAKVLRAETLRKVGL